MNPNNVDKQKDLTNHHCAEHLEKIDKDDERNSETSEQNMLHEMVQFDIQHQFPIPIPHSANPPGAIWSFLVQILSHNFLLK